ncbi:MAG TPA: helix-turn-helix transcriptional regulator [Phenylobacterium sp.]|nr:helix-turn-helix transcriptional regulator [Phenylobacterium sp.]
METKSAITSLSALAHEGRLSAYRLLVQAGPDGLAAGDLARRLDILPNTLSASLNILSHAGLVESRRDGRSIIYTAQYDQMSELLAFLMEDCCSGSPEICGPLVKVASRTCAAAAPSC